jgi:hypothetical protein
MGTSTPFNGGKNSNPLIPSWLDDPSGDPGLPPAPRVPREPEKPSPQRLDAPPPSNPQPPLTPPASPAPPPPPENRYTPGRKAFNKGARSGNVSAQFAAPFLG